MKVIKLKYYILPKNRGPAGHNRMLRLYVNAVLFILDCNAIENKQYLENQRGYIVILRDLCNAIKKTLDKISCNWHFKGQLLHNVSPATPPFGHFDIKAGSHFFRKFS